MIATGCGAACASTHEFAPAAVIVVAAKTAIQAEYCAFTVRPGNTGCRKWAPHSTIYTHVADMQQKYRLDISFVYKGISGCKAFFSHRTIFNTTIY
jgi:hypothetical protein